MDMLATLGAALCFLGFCLIVYLAVRVFQSITGDE